MADNDEVYKVGLDFANFAAGFKEFQDHLKDSGAVVSKFADDLTSIDPEGKVTKTFRAITESGDVFITTMRQTADGVKVTRFQLEGLRDLMVGVELDFQHTTAAAKQTVETWGNLGAATSSVVNILKALSAELSEANQEWLRFKSIVDEATAATVAFERIPAWRRGAANDMYRDAPGGLGAGANSANLSGSVEQERFFRSDYSRGRGIGASAESDEHERLSSVRAAYDLSKATEAIEGPQRAKAEAEARGEASRLSILADYAAKNANLEDAEATKRAALWAAADATLEANLVKDQAAWNEIEAKALSDNQKLNQEAADYKAALWAAADATLEANLAKDASAWNEIEAKGLSDNQKLNQEAADYKAALWAAADANLLANLAKDMSAWNEIEAKAHQDNAKINEEHRKKNGPNSDWFDLVATDGETDEQKLDKGLKIAAANIKQFENERIAAARTAKLEAENLLIQESADRDASLRERMSYVDKLKVLIFNETQATIDAFEKKHAVAQQESDDALRFRIAYVEKQKAMISAEKAEKSKDEKATPGFAEGFGGAFSSRFGAQALGTAAGGLIIGAVTEFTGALKQGIETSIEFDRRIARLQATQRDAALSSEQLAKEVLKLSSAFNADAMDVALARQRAVAQGAVKSADAYKYLNSTLALGQVTGTSAVEATDAVSAAINSFSLKATDAAHVSEVFFKSYKESGVDLHFLADQMGRLGSVAAPLGFRLEEVAAIFGTFTRRGIQGGEAAATLSNWFQRLAAPTPELTARLHELGFATAEEAVRAGHLADVLTLLSHEANISSESVVKLLGGIRTSRGGLGEVGFFQEAIDKMREYRNESNELEEANKKVQESSGEHLKQLGTGIKNWFTEVGEGIVKAADAVVKALGDLEKKKGLIGTLFPDARTKAEKEADSENESVHGTSADDTGSQFAGTKKQVDAEVKAALAYLNDPDRAHSPIELANNQIKIQAAYFQGLDQLIQKAFDPKTTLDKRVHDQVEASLKIKNTYREQVEAQIAAEQLLTKKLKDELSIRLSRYEDSVKQHLDVANKARDIARESEQRVAELQANSVESRFKRQMSFLTPEQQARQLAGSIPGSQIQPDYNVLEGRNVVAERYNRLLADRETHFANLETKQGEAFLSSKDLEQAQKDSQEINKVQEEQAAAVAEAYKNHKASLQDVYTMEGAITAEKQRQQQLEEKLQEAMRARVVSEKTAADAEKERFSRIKEASEAFLNLQYDKSKFTTPEQYLARSKEFKDKALSSATGTSEFIGLTQLFQQKDAENKAVLERAKQGDKVAEQTKDALKGLADAQNAKDLPQHMEEYVKKQTEIFQNLSNDIRALLTGGKPSDTVMVDGKPMSVLAAANAARAGGVGGIAGVNPFGNLNPHGTDLLKTGADGSTISTSEALRLAGGGFSDSKQAQVALDAKRTTEMSEQAASARSKAEEQDQSARAKVAEDAYAAAQRNAEYARHVKSQAQNPQDEEFLEQQKNRDAFNELGVTGGMSTHAIVNSIDWFGLVRKSMSEKSQRTNNDFFDSMGAKSSGTTAGTSNDFFGSMGSGAGKAAYGDQKIWDPKSGKSYHGSLPFDMPEHALGGIQPITMEGVNKSYKDRIMSSSYGLAPTAPWGSNWGSNQLVEAATQGIFTPSANPTYEKSNQNGSGQVTNNSSVNVNVSDASKPNVDLNQVGKAFQKLHRQGRIRIVGDDNQVRGFGFSDTPDNP